MQKKLFLLCLVAFYNLTVTAQLNPDPNVKSAYEYKKELPGNLYNQLIESLKPSAFTGSYEKQKSALLIKETAEMNGSIMAKKITALSAAIKPDMFKKGYSLPATGGGKTMVSSIGLLKNLENALKPEALSGGWQFQKKSWLDQANKVK